MMGGYLDLDPCPTHIGFAGNTNSQSMLVGLTGEQMQKCNLWETFVCWFHIQHRIDTAL